MIINDLKIKENLSLKDETDMVNMIVSFYFYKDDYTPFLADLGKQSAIIKYYIDGYELEEGETIDNCLNEPKIMSLVSFVLNANENFKRIEKFVDDIVDFEKQRIIHTNYDLQKLVECADVIIDSLGNFSKLDFESMNDEDLQIGLNVMRQLNDMGISVESINNVIKQNVDFNMNEAMKEIVDSKNKEIEELKQANKKEIETEQNNDNDDNDNNDNNDENEKEK